MVWPSRISPTSFVDDGALIDARFPPKKNTTDNTGIRTDRARNTRKDTRIQPRPASPSTATYTGSFMDDGADLVPRLAPGAGFGSLDRRFYEEKRVKGRTGVSDHAAIQRAVSGDINATMRKIRAVGDFRVKVAAAPLRGMDPGTYIPGVKGWGEREEAKRREQGRVLMGEEMPVRFEVMNGSGTFVIYGEDGEDGRVIVVDSDGEYDSGPIPMPMPMPQQTRPKLKSPPQPQRRPGGGKHVKFEEDWWSKVAAKSNSGKDIPPPAQWVRQEVQKAMTRAERKQEKKQEKTGQEDRQFPTLKPSLHSTDAQGAWMSGGRSGWTSLQPLQSTKPSWGKPEENQDTWSHVAVGWFSPTASNASEDSWQDDLDKMNKIDRFRNYHSATVEDVPEAPMKKARYKNGYDDENDTYLNAQRGGAEVWRRVALRRVPRCRSKANG